MGEYDTIFEAIAPALRHRLMGSVLRNVRERDGQDSVFVFLLRSTGENHYLTLHTSGGFFFLDTDQRPAPNTPTPFTMYARKHVVGCRIEDIAWTEGALHLTWASPGMRWLLHFEPRGEQSLLMLCDADNHIVQSPTLASLHRRHLALNESYTPSPYTQHTRVERPANWPSDPDALWPFVAAYFQEGYERQQFQHACQAIKKKLKRERKKSARRLAHVEQDLLRAEDAAVQREEADLLQSVRHRVPRGTPFVDIPDWHTPDMRVRRILLDPSEGIEHAIARRYKDYQRYKKAEMRILERVEEVQRQHDALEEAWEKLATLHSIDAIEAFVQDGLARGLWRLERTQQQIHQNARKPYREALSSDGYRILIGKSAKDNDTLSLHIARGRDLWLHARDVSGSHVIVWRDHRDDIPTQTIREAATLAAYFSSAKNDTTVDVGYTERKYISKAKGAPPGSVHVAAMRTLLVTPDASLCKELLSRAWTHVDTDNR